MARIATFAAGLALMVGQPITAAWAQPSSATTTQSESDRRDGGGESFFRGRTDRIALALGALAAVILGLATIGKDGGKNNNGPRPTSP